MKPQMNADARRTLFICVHLWFQIFLLLLLVSDLRAAESLRIAWTNNMLTIAAVNLPGKTVTIWYLEAFCRSGSTHRDWRQTTIPHKTELLSAAGKGRRLQLRTLVEPEIEVLHDIRVGRDDIDFRLTLKNRSDKFVDLQWFQPCMRVDRF